MRKGIIYHAFDTITGRAWVGQTWRTLAQRRFEHENPRPGKNFPLSNALKKRPDDFVWTILVDGLLNQKDMDDAEDAFIIELNTLYPSGFNLKRGGASGLFTPEALARLSAAMRGNTIRKGSKTSAEQKRKLSAALKGRVFSEEHRKKISEGSKRREERRRKAKHGRSQPDQQDGRQGETGGIVKTSG